MESTGHEQTLQHPLPLARGAWVNCVLCTLIDVIGHGLSMSTMVTYPLSLNITLPEIGGVTAGGMASRAVGGVALAVLSDRLSGRWAIVLNNAGSSLAYLVTALASYASAAAGAALLVFVIGRVLGGLFGGSFWLIIGLVTKFTKSEGLLKSRVNVLFVTWAVVPVVFNPLGALLAYWLGLNATFLLSSAVALGGTLFAFWSLRGADAFVADAVRSSNGSSNSFRDWGTRAGASPSMWLLLNRVSSESFFWLTGLAYFCLGININFRGLALPVYLSLPEFGVVDQGQEFESQEARAS